MGDRIAVAACNDGMWIIGTVALIHTDGRARDVEFDDNIGRRFTVNRLCVMPLHGLNAVRGGIS